MDNYEATKVVLTKIQSMDPENASKIMGYILIQDLGDKELIRLALGPETLLLSLINEAKSCLGLGNNGGNNNGGNKLNPFSQTTPRILIPNSNNNGGLFHHQNPSSPSLVSSPWSSSNAAAFSRNSPRPAPPAAASYASVVNGGVNNGGGGVNNASGSSSSSLSLPFYGGNNNNHHGGVNNGELNDEFVGNLQFLEEGIENNNNHHFNHHHHPMMSPSGRSDSMIFPYEEPPNTPNPLHHRRSFSVNDVFLGGGGNGVEDVGGGVGGGGNGFGWRPCMYYARGFCKNGSNCKFLHGGFDSPDGVVVPGGGGGGGSSPGKIDGGGFDEFLRMKAIQQQRLAAASQLMASGGQHHHHPFPFNNKALTFLNDNQRSAAAAMMMGEEFHKFGRFRPDRANFVNMGLDANSSSRQIYLTFPADSTFKEEDVSTYFSMYGPVQDVRIPYQPKRMFGFVTFVYPETVKLILAKGNPHFVCDSRVLVKPYKEKGKIADKKHQQQQQQQLIEQGEFSACLSPTGFDARESFDHPFGAGMFYNTQEMMLRRKMEERAELQHMIDLQGRRLMGMQMMDTTNHQNSHPFMPNISSAIPIPSPRQNQSHMNQNLMFLSDGSGEVQEGISTSQERAISPTVAANAKVTREGIESSDDNNGSENGNKEEDDANLKDSDLHESFDHMLPDNLFASPTKSAAENHSLFGGDLSETTETIPSENTSSNNVTVSSPLKPCNFEMPSH